VLQNKSDYPCHKRNLPSKHRKQLAKSMTLQIPEDANNLYDLILAYSKKNPTYIKEYLLLYKPETSTKLKSL
jgi:hypothetical protein